MYHFKETEHAASALVLDEYLELSGHAVRYLKEFQISAVRFMYDHLCKREFCILNDESGLGKTATSAVLLGIVAMKKNCLIVVANKDERVTDWRFHLDVLTDLHVRVLDEEKDYNDSVSSVYIAKWSTLHVIEDLSKMHFDVVVLDNRELMLNNTFCMSTLLKNFERKVQLVISSIDLTSDVKLMHNILRLGGRLEHRLESFRAFEEKFHLPDLKAISNKKSDLEEYFLKREILSDYCREFRLRRYRHQFEHMLPLVDPERYRAHLAHWKEIAHVEKQAKSTSVIGEIMPTELGTEELLQQYVSQANHSQQIDEEIQQITKDMNSLNRERNSSTQGRRMTPSDTNDDELNMSPLVYITESESDADEVVLLSSNSIETVIPIIEIDDGDDDVQICTLSNHRTQKAASDKQPAASHCEESTNENGQQQKDKFATVETVRKKRRQTPPMKIAYEEANVDKTPVTKRTRSKSSTQMVEEENKTPFSRRTLRKDNQVDVTMTMTRKTTARKIDGNKKTPSKAMKNTDGNLVCKIEKISPRRCSAAVVKSSSPEVSSHTDTLKIPQTLSNCDAKSSSPKPNSDKRTKVKKKEIDTPSSVPKRVRNSMAAIVGIPQRETRNMQRTTRSAGGKRKCFALEFDDDKKPKSRATPKKSSPTSKAALKDNKQNKESPKTTKQQATTAKTTTNKKESTTQKKKSTTTTKATKLSQPSTQGTILPPSSDYEEMQCGQKLASYENSPHLSEKPCEFLLPSTPPSLRILHYSLLQSQHTGAPKSLTLLENDSDIAMLTNGTNDARETVILLSSSHDEASLSSQASTEERRQSTGTQKRKRYSKRVTVKEPSSFGVALAKERSVVASSPDVFSTGSDIGSSNVIPFTQIHCAAAAAATSTPRATTAFGFKIFGSEVRRLQDIPTPEPTVASSQRQPRVNRSCLNILEQMFEKKNPTAIHPPSSSAAQIKTRKRQTAVSNTEASQTGKVATKTSPVAPRKPIHERSIHKRIQQTQHTMQRADITSDDIFEITNNVIFGSTLRINASGNISPVQQLNSSQHHNKITNYLIGSGNATKHIISGGGGGGADDEQQQMFGTPSKRLAATQQTGGGARKSPKSAKLTQTTKLTKWFRRSSMEDTIKAAKESLKEPKATKTTKRRRLDLSFKS